RRSLRVRPLPFCNVRGQRSVRQIEVGAGDGEGPTPQCGVGPSKLRSERTNVRRLGALGSLLRVELDLLCFLEVAVSAALNRAEVREDIGGTVVGSNE